MIKDHSLLSVTQAPTCLVSFGFSDTDLHMEAVKFTDVMELVDCYESEPSSIWVGNKNSTTLEKTTVLIIASVRNLKIVNGSVYQIGDEPQFSDAFTPSLGSKQFCELQA
ncbi:unnamed protein product [Linum trigynum]|uniref:Uncharacterized protein n=1 Tax=Linum trigynum TaxID=586398 RepID=A0AAV2DB62_9ROSI